jgi:drug/metabolite transporter (DMT)-like permease
MPVALLAVIAAVIFGSADFLGGMAAKHLRSLVVTAVSAFSGLFLLLLAMGALGTQWLPLDALRGALSGILSVAAVGLLYACLAIGPMSILSPLTAVVSAIVPLLWGLLVRHETLSALAWTVLGFALVATVLVGFVPGEKVVRPSARGLVMAVCSGTAIGGFMIIMSSTTAASGVLPLIFNRAVNGVITTVIVVVSTITMMRRGRTLRGSLAAGGPQLGASPDGRADLEHARAHGEAAPVLARAWWIAIGAGLVDATANTLTLIALRSGDLAIVSALTAMYPAGTILLAALVLRERIAGVQWLGLGLALASGVLLAVG